MLNKRIPLLLWMTLFLIAIPLTSYASYDGASLDVLDSDTVVSGEGEDEEVYGYIESFPAELIGEWMVDGVTYSADANTVTFKWKDYRVKSDDKQSAMRIATDEFIRRFLIHVLPDRFHRIRQYGLLASSQRKTNIAKARALLGAQHPKQEDAPAEEVIPLTLREPCPDCGGAMRIIETFRRGQKPQSRAPPRKRAA